ncbi:MAG: hypothetical protein Q8R24_11040 [Legionellaceae bacterium]|nr:hypothetical protein [Legionellaceae bacterium]
MKLIITNPIEEFEDKHVVAILAKNPKHISIEPEQGTKQFILYINTRVDNPNSLFSISPNINEVHANYTLFWRQQWIGTITPDRATIYLNTHAVSCLKKSDPAQNPYSSTSSILAAMKIDTIKEEEDDDDEKTETKSSENSSTNTNFVSSQSSGPMFSMGTVSVKKVGRRRRKLAVNNENTNIAEGTYNQMELS